MRQAAIGDRLLAAAVRASDDEPTGKVVNRAVRYRRNVVAAQALRADAVDHLVRGVRYVDHLEREDFEGACNCHMKSRNN